MPTLTLVQEPAALGYAGPLLMLETTRVELRFHFTYDGLDHTACCLRT
jgi:hypothetical protein